MVVGFESFFAVVVECLLRLACQHAKLCTTWYGMMDGGYARSRDLRVTRIFCYFCLFKNPPPDSLAFHRLICLERLY